MMPKIKEMLDQKIVNLAHIPMGDIPEDYDPEEIINNDSWCDLKIELENGIKIYCYDVTAETKEESEKRGVGKK